MYGSTRDRKWTMMSRGWTAPPLGASRNCTDPVLMKRTRLHWIKSNRGGWRAWAALLSICGSLAAAAAPTSPWVTHVWESDDGLPNNNVTSLAQTPDGFLWVA